MSDLSWYLRSLLAILSGAALALSFPNYNLPLLAWLAVGLLILACFGAGSSAGFFYGWLHGVVFYPLSVPWIDTVMHQYGSVDPLTSAGILALLSVAFALFPAVFGWAVALVSTKVRPGKNWAFVCLNAPFLWVALEYARTYLILGGFPWNLTGYAASGSLGLLQLAAITGIYGLSFVVAAWSSLVVYAILSGRQIVWKAALAATGVLILWAGAGKYFVPVAEPHHVAHLVQTDFPQSESYPGNWMQLHAGELEQLERISVGAAQDSSQRPSLIVWPEVPAPFSMQDPAFTQLAQKIARDSASDFLVGIVDWKHGPNGAWDASNTAILLNPVGLRTFTYDKIHLVPFGEFVPYRHLLSFAGRLTADISDFTPGKSYAVGKVPDGTFGVFICYEAIFPAEVREFTRNGAQLLINISNDGWFGRSAAPAQHLMMARVRAVENRRWLLRDTNNGFTASIDPYGRIVAELPVDVRTELNAPYDFRTGFTPYVRFGDWFGWLCILASLAILIVAILQHAPQPVAKPARRRDI
ncbi:MAG TPA: apolipoprotein N-acyltransferase [Candidatus Acidoferrales bacterium]|nr:apolipoprotein N-acyltransferase [Candidatus Acidoferrales bacterium]